MEMGIAQKDLRLKEKNKKKIEESLIQYTNLVTKENKGSIYRTYNKVKD